MSTEKKEEPKFIQTIKETWATPAGKVGLTAVTVLGAMLYSGVFTRVLAFMIGGIKDVRDASKR